MEKWFCSHLSHISVRDFISWMLECSAVTPVLEMLEIAELHGLREAGFLAKEIREGRHWQLGKGYAEYDQRGWVYPEDIDQEAEKINAIVEFLLCEEQDLPVRIVWIENMLKNEAKQEAHVLDVGCCHGEYLFYLASRLSELRFTGLEPNSTEHEIALQVCERRKKICSNLQTIVHGTLIDFPIDPKWDVVLFSDVLEHVVYPGKLIQAAYERLAPGGFVAGSVPVFPEDPELPLTGRCHVNQFTQYSLARLLYPEFNFKIDALFNSSFPKPMGFFMFKAWKSGEPEPMSNA